MSAEENKALILRMFESGNQENLAETEEFIAPTIVVHDVDKPDVHGNYQGHQDFLTWFNATFSGQTTIEDITAEGDTVVVRATFHGIQKSEWNGRPAGQEVTFTGITTYRIVDGKVVESWHKHLTW